MLEYQYIRSILIVTDLLSFIVGFIVASDAWRGGRPIYHAIASFLLLSWVHGLFMLFYTANRLSKARKEGYFRVPMAGNEDFVVDDVPGSWKIGSKMGILTFIVDALIGVALLLMFPVAFASSRVQLSGVACMGAIVSMMIHLFFCVVYIMHDSKDNGFWKYKVKLVVVRKDQEINIATKVRAKEQQTAEQASLQEPEQTTPRPYHGSPSTRPSHGTTSPREGPIRLVE